MFSIRPTEEDLKRRYQESENSAPAFSKDQNSYFGMEANQRLQSLDEKQEEPGFSYDYTPDWKISQ